MNIGHALLLSLLAGLATMIGSILSLMVKEPSKKFLTLSLGFSAGVMLFVSFVELLAQGIKSIGHPLAYIAFFIGMGLMFLIDNLVPHDYMAEHNVDSKLCKNVNLCRAGFFIALGIAIHNFPEGIAVFAGALTNVKIGIALAIAIALHNIPEGIAVSVPVYAATHSRRKAFLWSALSGLAEPLGALIAAVFLLPFLKANVIGFVLASVAGIMVFISIDELVPVSKSYGEEHLSILGLMAGMIVMAISLWLMGCY
ncbi:MAG: zinc transporter ZupT [bacterium]